MRTSELLEVPDWVSRFAVRGFGTLPRQVWLRPAKAKLLLVLDRAAGGRSEFAKTEFRRCLLCSRPMISVEAEAYRKQLESGDRSIPCGRDCARARELRIYAAWAPLSQAQLGSPKAEQTRSTVDFTPSP